VGIASIVLNVLSVITVPMVLAVGVMDSPRTTAGHLRGLKVFLIGYFVVVLGSIAAAWWLRSESRPGAALLVSLSPAAGIALGFGLLAVSGFGKRG
jgi:hypothetical protein